MNIRHIDSFEKEFGLSEVDCQNVGGEWPGFVVKPAPVGTFGVDGKTAAERVRMTRKAKGMSQAELARRIGMKPSQLCKIELGSSDVTAKAGRRLAEGLGVELSWLLCGEEG